MVDSSATPQAPKRVSARGFRSALAFVQYEIPVWHPVVVHFPIALLTFGAGAAVAYAVLGRAFWRRVALLAVAPGAVLAWAAVATGEALYEEVEGTPLVEELIERHEVLGEWAFWVSLIAAAALAGVTLWLRRTGSDPARPEPLALRLGVAALVAAAAVLVLLAGRSGGTMVWGVPG